MPFDPNKPVAHTLNSAEEMRGQLNGLHDLIVALNAIAAAQVDAVNTINHNEPATATVNLVGNTLHFSFDIPRGGVGVPGPPFAQALVDAVNTLDAGQAATVTVDFDGTNVRFTFGIPRGNDGTNGVDGTNGNDGAMGPPFTNFLVDGVTTLNANEPATVAANFDGNAVRLLFGIPRGNDGNQGQAGNNGNDGAMGPPFTNFVVDGVTTLNANNPATVAVNFDGNAVRLLFGIPRGLDGQNGMNGNDGNTGPQGIQGPPGEVTNATLANAISGTSSNTNGVMTLGLVVSDPPTQGEMQALVSKVDDLILALRN